MRLRFNQAETFLDPIQTGIDAVDTNGYIGDLHFQAAHTLGQLKNTTAHRIELLAYRAQMLENHVVRFGHDRSLARFPFIFYSRLRLTPPRR